MLTNLLLNILITMPVYPYKLLPSIYQELFIPQFSVDPIAIQYLLFFESSTPPSPS